MVSGAPCDDVEFLREYLNAEFFFIETECEEPAISSLDEDPYTRIFFYYKNKLYKNYQARIRPKTKDKLRKITRLKF